MTTLTRMHFQFEDVDGNDRQINRQSFESTEQFVTVSKDLLTSGLGIADICRKYELPDNPTNVDATYRDGPGQAYLVKLIIEDGLVPHPRFLEYRSGRRIKDEVTWRGYGHLLKGEPIAADEQVNRPQVVDVEDPPEDHGAWINRMNDKADQLEGKLGKIEAYDRGIAFIKENLNSRKNDGRIDVLADILRLVLEAFDAQEDKS